MNLEPEIASVPVWLPLAMIAGSVGYAIYRLVCPQVAEAPEVTETAVPPEAAPRAWPSASDRLYFDSEMHLASTYLELARSTAVRADSVECLRRAADVHADVTEWVAAHGGEEEFERRLERLQWLIDAADAPGRHNY